MFWLAQDDLAPLTQVLKSSTRRYNVYRLGGMFTKRVTSAMTAVGSMPFKLAVLLFDDAKSKRVRLLVFLAFSKLSRTLDFVPLQ